ncbi:MAG: PBP1A family penicillin-binding protein [Myxococcales bacterium]|nr:PBP1A family penicillin-binding protein [Myxococcales bacterium]
MNVSYVGERPTSWVSFFIRLTLFFSIVGGIIVVVAGAGVYLYLATTLPNLKRLADYEPRVVTRVYDQSGQLIGELFKEKRSVVGYDELPPKLVAAFIASEDDRFFSHSGVDFFGILRAVIANTRAGRVVQGGSTITQQVAKSLIVSSDGYSAGTARNYSRKIREAILARQLENNLSKRDILTIYLNQMFLGNQSYGVQAAAQNYFRKNVSDLSVAEIALLAGLPQAPSRYSPFVNPRRAQKRRVYVLRRMLEENIITPDELAEAENTAINVYPAPNYRREISPYFTEEVRRQLSNEFDESTLLEGGLKVYTTVDVERYRAAEDAAYVQLRMVDKRQGYQGPLLRYTISQRAEKKRFVDRYTQELKRRGQTEQLRAGELHVGLVTNIDRSKNVIELQIGPHQAFLPLQGMRWARRLNPQVRYDSALLKQIPPNFRRGDILLVRATTPKSLSAQRGFSAKQLQALDLPTEASLVVLEQEPRLETALMSVHNESGYVLAMLGGYAFGRSEFNRATQSCRQPGSAFKPIIYSAAIHFLNWTPAQTILDAPLAFNDATSGLRWKPSNISGQFQGEVSMRYALQNSMNLPAIRILDAVGTQQAIQWAQQLGITTDLRPELGLALGASCAKMVELTNVYRTFANQGRRSTLRYITRIEDRHGKVLVDRGWPGDPFASIQTKLKRAINWISNPPDDVVDPNTSFLISKMMRNVVENGTGTAAKAVGVPVAGKTGTTNDSFDAWFIGFTKQLTTAVWVGFDDYKLPMGRYEQGGRAALPLWVNYMKQAVKAPSGWFDPPPDIVFVPIDGKTGKRVPSGTPGAVEEAFIAGTEPTATAVADSDSEEFLKQDY